MNTLEALQAVQAHQLQPASAITHCGSCLYWEKDEKWTDTWPKLGTCHRRAPVPAFYTVNHAACWPITNENQGCGDGAEKKV